MQKTTFPVEIIIHDDASTDRTAEIVREYEKKHPDLITAIYQTENQYSKGKKISPTYVFPRAKGKYIALCEGDDYWTDPYKLQKQVDYLEEHSECTISFHNVKIIYEDGKKRARLNFPKKVYTIEDLLEGNFIDTCSTMFRNGLVLEFPGWFYKLPMGDWPLNILIAHHGDIGYLDGVMGVYRIHSGSLWSSRGKIQNCLDVISTYRIIYSQLDRKYRRSIRFGISHRYYTLYKLYQEKRDRSGAVLNLFKCFTASPGRPFLPLRELLREMLELFLPGAVRILSLLKKQTLKVVRQIGFLSGHNS